MIRQASTGSQEQRGAIRPVTQMHRGSLEQQKTQDVDIGGRSRDVLNIVSLYTVVYGVQGRKGEKTHYRRIA